MSKVQIKEVMRTTANGVLQFRGNEVFIEVEGFDEPIPFVTVFNRYNEELVGIAVNLKTDHVPE